MEDGANKRPIKFEELEAWKQARELTALVYRLCRGEPLGRGSMSYVLRDNEFVSATDQRDIYDRAVRCGKLISGLLRSAEGRK